jgi:nucleoside-triphosphatase THEP1
MFGTISIIKDLLEFEKSILILGRPGVGKTTIIRETSRILADEMEKRVIIIDTSNEIAGDSDIPHPVIGQARRMQVTKRNLQHQVMIEAVENHMPQVIIIDEIGTELEVLAAQTIAEKGVQLIGTTHGNCLENVIKNPLLASLIGGIQYVTLSDDEAKRRKTQKTILERQAAPTFEIIIEINSPNTWTVHENVQASIDLFLRSNLNAAQTRIYRSKKVLKIKCRRSQNYCSLRMQNQVNVSTKKLAALYIENWILINQAYKEERIPKKEKMMHVYLYSLSSNLIQEACSKLGVTFTFTKNLKKADLIIGLKKHFKQNFRLKDLLKGKNVPIYTLNKVNLYQVTKLIKSLNF